MSPNKKKYITFEERKTIEKLLEEKKSVAHITQFLNRPRSTISYEINKRGDKNSYCAEESQNNSYKRSSKKFDFKKRIENLEMQVEILSDTIKEIRKQNAKD